MEYIKFDEFVNMTERWKEGEYDNSPQVFLADFDFEGLKR